MRTRQSAWLLGAVVSLAAATPGSAAEMRFGVIGGAVFAKVPALPANVVGLGPGQTYVAARRTGFTGGGAVEWEISNIGTLRVEPRFVQKGSEFDRFIADRATGKPSGAAVSSGEVILSYLDVPAMFRSEYLKKKPVQIYVMTGIGPNFLLSAKSGGRDVKNSFKGVEFGLVSCVGLMRKTDRVHVSLDFRIGTTFIGTRIDDPAQTNKSKNNSYQTTIGLTFPKK